MQKILTRFLPLLLLLLFVGQVQAKTLVYCSEGSPEGFNPALYTAGTTFDASSKNVFEGLTHFKQGTTELEPGMAEGWTVSDDGLTYIFKLRKGVKFHSAKHFKPSRNMNADDVIYTFERQWKKDHPFYGISGGNYEYFNGMSMPDLLSKIEKIDDYTVKFTLARPEAPMLANLGMDFAVIQSAEYADVMMKAGTPEKVDQWPIGTGPFAFRGYKKDAQIRYIAFADYWKGKAAIDKLVFSITPDASVRYAKLKAGECHIMPYPNPADVAAMQADSEINLMQQEGLNVGYLAYNTQVAPFDNVKVRKALNKAMNKQAIIDTVFQGAGKIAKNPIPPTIWSYNEATVDDTYDPVAAKKMLAEAGYPNGFEMKVWAMPVQRPYNPNARRMAEVIQADFAKVGVKVEIISYEWGEYLKRSKDVNRDGAVLLGWTGDNGDPDNFLAVLLGCDGVGGSNRANFCYKPFEDLIQKAKIVSDPAQRTKIYEQAQVVFKEQAPWATIAHSVVFKPLSKNVVNFKIDPFGGHIFYGVDLK
ncbi:MAG: ABC transporter substrate-binding protein [Thermodesulfobacteriota bacterium]|nr:ABC transporter substrate-binding protein [Thermodesulfobacteriota bacterium]